MKLAASNIAWDPSEDDAAAKVLRSQDFSGVEIAPGKRWESPIEATKREIEEYKSYWTRKGLVIVGIQSLLFGRNDLQLFGSTTVRRAMREYIAALIELTAGLGGRSLVFGSPKNRKRGKMPLAEANEIACEFFRDVGAFAHSRGCVICIEANSPEYDCDFITTTAESIELCQAINSRGVGVNIDGGTLASGGEDPAPLIASAGPRVAHVHASEPGLGELTDSLTHGALAAALRLERYAGWVSIEMRPPPSGSALEALDRAARVTKSIYQGS